MERVPFRVVPDALSPANDDARFVLSRFHVGELVAVEMYHRRDNKVSNRAQLAFEKIGKAYGYRIRNVRGWIASVTGRADLVEIDGDRALVAWGTGPRDMNAAEFQGFWEDAIDVITARILPTLDRTEADAILRLLY